MSDTTGDVTARPSRPQSWLLILAVVALPSLSYPLAWFSQQSAPERFQFEVPISLLYLAGVLAVIVVHLLKTERPQLAPTQIDRLVLAVLGVGLVSILLSRNAAVSISAWVVLLSNVSLLYVAGVWFNLDLARPLQTTWLVAATAQAGYTLLLVTNREYPVGTIGNRDWEAGYLGASMLVCFPLWKSCARRPVLACLLGACYLVLARAFWVCNSLGAWIGFGVAALLCVVRILWPKRRAAALGVVAVVVLGAAGLAAANFNRLHATWLTNVRPSIWRGTVNMIADSPLIGHGLGTYTYQYQQYRPPDYFNTNVLAGINVPADFKHKRQPATLTDHAHNELLEIAGETGLLGLGIMLWLFVTVLVRGWRGGAESNPDRWLLLGAWGAFIALLVHNQFDINLRKPPNQSLLWLLMGLVLRCSPAPTRPDEPGSAMVFGRRSSEDALSRRQRERADAAATRVERGLKLALCIGLIIALMRFQVHDRVAASAAWRQALIERGQGAIPIQQAERAMELYLLCLKHDPYRIDAWYRLAYLCAHFPQTDEQAIDYYLQVASLAPDYGDVNSNLAHLFIQRGKKRDAVTYLQRAIQLNPYRVDLREGLARLYLDLNLALDLKEQLLEIMSLDPQHPWANDIWNQNFKLEKKEIPEQPATGKKKLAPSRLQRPGL